MDDLRREVAPILYRRRRHDFLLLGVVGEDRNVGRATVCAGLVCRHDELLDAELPRMYDMVEAAHHAGNPMAARHFADLARKLYTLVAEVTEITEKVDNALQVTEDVYLARVYTSALDLFRVRHVSEAVDRKLSIIRDTYAALYEEASGKRAELLEIAIIALIVVEIVIAVLRH